MGFPLRCFQRLSRISVATRRCRWCDNRHTRDWLNLVLSSYLILCYQKYRLYLLRIPRLRSGLRSLPCYECYKKPPIFIHDPVITGIGNPVVKGVLNLAWDSSHLPLVWPSKLTGPTIFIIEGSTNLSKLCTPMFPSEAALFTEVKFPQESNVDCG